MDVRVVSSLPTSDRPETDYVRVRMFSAPHDDTVTLATIERVTDKAKKESADESPTAKKIKKLWNKALKKDPTIEQQGDVIARSTADGALVWMMVNVDLGNKDSDPVPHRAFYVYQRSEDAEGGWSLVAAHEAVLTF